MEPSKAEIISNGNRSADCPLEGEKNNTREANGLYHLAKIDDVERLLLYAAECGVEIDAEDRTAVLKAKSTPPNGWTEEISTNLLLAYTNLAAKLKPVTAASLEKCAIRSEINKTMRTFRGTAYFLAFFILTYSVGTFVTAALSKAMRQDIEKANALAVKLSDEVRAPAEGKPITRNAFLRHGVTEKEVTRDLQQFTATIRAIDARARQLNLFAFRFRGAPYDSTQSEPSDPKLRKEKQESDRQQRKDIFELPAALPDFFETTTSKIAAYQDVRHFAESLVETVSVFYGAMAACLLPVLYALLGACAYLLRTFEEQVRKRTFLPSDTNAARFMIAGICGGVVGLFNNFTINEAASISPLAIAFLVGYAVDVFFSSLERLIQPFTKAKDEAPPQKQVPDAKTTPLISTKTRTTMNLARKPRRGQEKSVMSFSKN